MDNPPRSPIATSRFAQLGRWITQHKTLTLSLWIGLMVLSLMLSPSLESSLKGAWMTYEGGEARQTELQLQQELQLASDPLTVVFQGRPHQSSTQMRQDVATLVAQIRGVSGVRSVLSAAEHPEYRSADGQVEYAVLNLNPNAVETAATIDDIEARLHQNAIQGLQTFVSGKAIVDREAQRISKADSSRAELLALPLTLVAMLFVFGSVVAASLPVAMGVLSVSTTFGLLYFVAQQMPLSALALNFSSMLGLGLGIDYSLLIVNRFREELQSGSPQQAAIRTVATAGKAVFFSGLIVCISLVCLLLFPIALLQSMGMAGSLVVILSVAVALTVLPALLVWIGPRIHWGSRWIRPLNFKGNVWMAIARQVTRHSWLAVISVCAAIAVLTAPFFNIHFGLGDASVLPKSIPARQAVEVIQQAFGVGEPSPILLMVQTREKGDRILAAPHIDTLYRLVQQLKTDPRVAKVSSLVNLDPQLGLSDYQQLYGMSKAQLPKPIATAMDAYSSRSTTLISITSRTASHAPASHQLVTELRQLSFDGLRVKVGGQSASEIDTLQEVSRRFPLILAAIMVVTFAVLCLLFQSIVLPLKAILMNFLSIGASFGALVFVFQEGHFKEWLNFDPLGYLDILLPLVLFCVVFGLSMDYEVFLLTRIKESYDRCGNNTQSVVEGLERTGWIITNAALLMIIVTGAFALTRIIFMKALGVGIALAILLDATLIRVILVPATMHLMGQWNWWSPSFLRLDKVKISH
ncbi:MAG: MMPL family transporter [Thermosynechococcaceae cyanobacterium]